GPSPRSENLDHAPRIAARGIGQWLGVRAITFANSGATLIGVPCGNQKPCTTKTTRPYRASDQTCIVSSPDESRNVAVSWYACMPTCSPTTLERTSLRLPFTPCGVPVAAASSCAPRMTHDAKPGRTSREYQERAASTVPNAKV